MYRIFILAELRQQRMNLLLKGIHVEQEEVADDSPVVRTLIVQTLNHNDFFKLILYNIF